MADAEEDIPKITVTSTKKEMLDAYKLLTNKLREQAKAELKPEKIKEERKTKETIQMADTISNDPITKRLSDIKAAVAKELSDVAVKLEEETSRYNQIKAAIALKDQELKEIFEIERNAFTLAALMESQKAKKLEFEAELADRKKILEEEIQQTRELWQKEKQQYMETSKEQKKEEDKIRKREKEEYDYAFKREQELQKARLNDDLEALEKEILRKRSEFELTVASKEAEIEQREKTVGEREKHADDLEARVATFPQELETRVDQAVAQAVASVKINAQKNEELIVKGFEGEKNVLLMRIEGLEKMVATQNRQIEGLSKQIEKAYEKVQEIAVKAVSGSQSAPAPSLARTTGSVESNKI